MNVRRQAKSTDTFSPSVLWWNWEYFFYRFPPEKHDNTFYHNSVVLQNRSKPVMIRKSIP